MCPPRPRLRPTLKLPCWERLAVKAVFSQLLCVPIRVAEKPINLLAVPHQVPRCQLERKQKRTNYRRRQPSK